MADIYTVRTFLSLWTFGYETTQIFRQKVFEDLGHSHTLICGTPFEIYNWESELRRQGFDPEHIVILPRLYSNQNPFGTGYSLDDFEQDYLYGKSWETVQEVTPRDLHYRTHGEGYYDIHLNELGSIQLILHRSESGVQEYLVTVYEKPYYCHYFADNSFEYYHSDGSIALSGKTNHNVDCTFDLNGTVLSVEDLFLNYIQKLPKGSVVINDQIMNKYEKLKKYCDSSGLIYRSFLHFNHVFGKENKSTYSNQLEKEIFVASPYIIPELAKEGVKGIFLPPIAVDVSHHVPHGLTSNRLLLVGQIGKGKQIDLAIEAMKEVPELELHIYGGTNEQIEAFKKEHVIPSNVVFKGFYPSKQIQRNDYLAYLSCSQSEMFANAMVECLGEGLIPILSRVDYGHNQVLDEMALSDRLGFQSVGELIVILRWLANTTINERQNLSDTIRHYAKKFSLDAAKMHYRLALAQLETI